MINVRKTAHFRVRPTTWRVERLLLGGRALHQTQKADWKVEYGINLLMANRVSRPIQSHVIYQSEKPQLKVLSSTVTPKKKFWSFQPSFPKIPKQFFQGVALSFVIIALVVSGVLYAPMAYYHFFPAQVFSFSDEQDSGGNAGLYNYVPPVDATLPKGQWLSIPRIGVRTQLQKTQEAAEALENGVWLMPEYGQPGDRSKPMVVTAHRFGFEEWWVDDYWKYHSFYRLPELEVGDRIEVVADQRKWIYEVYAGEENTQITDYRADMILYTCKYLNSPVRYVRYAKLVDPIVNSQE